MPFGIVCQLRYHGGGFLQCGAEESLLPFWSSPTPLQVGQSVHFSLVKRGAHDEAADLQVVKPFAESIPRIQPSQSKSELFQSSGSYHSCHLWKPNQQPQQPCSQPKQPKLQQLQRQRQRFLNASAAERRRWLQRAEELLALLRSAEDGDGIIRWVYRLAAWLHPPGFLENSTENEADEAKDEAKDTTDCGGLQSWVRRLLILALTSLDLEDLNTYQKVEVALNYIAELLGREKCEALEVLPKNASLALQQWHQLQSLIGVEAPTDDWSHHPIDPSDPSDPSGTRARQRETMKGKDKSSSMDGIYRPNARVRSLPSVSIGDQVELQCVHCSERLHSNWYWFHPKKEKAYALAPQFGHAVCTKKVGKLCNWRSVDQTPTVLDNYHHLDFCQHKKRRSACIECEGTDICQHKRQRSHCRLCKAKNKAVKMDRHTLKRITFADAAVGVLSEIKPQQHNGCK